MSVRLVTIILRVLPWLLLAAIAFVTLSPIGLRPVTDAPPNVERAAAFAVLGAAFALGYPNRLGRVMVLVCAAAVGLEALQYVAAGRHARIGDAVVKLAGGLVGVLVGALLARILPREPVVPDL